MEVHKYFQSYEGYFWQWEEQGTVVAIPGSTTIAYKEFIIDLLEDLADQGFPSFGSLLLVLIATNPESKKPLETVYQLVDKKLGSLNSTKEPLNPALAFLDLLENLPSKYKQGKNRLLLLQTLFANCHNRVSDSRAREILYAYSLQNADENIFIPKAVFPQNVYINDFRTIQLLAKKFPDVASILEKLQDLPEFNEEILVDSVTDIETDKKGFIQELIENNKTFHVGALIKNLWSGLNIPYHNYLPSQQPIGGVSDLTNKGELHRLLISEFANEDDIFLSRLANQEALFMNREIPPANNELERIILIDVSLRNWGTPKVMAFAIFLAIARHPKTDVPCSVYAIGDFCQQLCFDTVDDIVSGLCLLETSLHAGIGIEKFFEQRMGKQKAEIFLISSTDSYRHPALHKAVSDHYTSFSYWIQTDTDGSVDIYKRQQNARRYVQHIKLPLKNLWKRPVATAVENSMAANVYYPILFPASVSPKKRLVAPDGSLFVVTGEKHLICAFDKQNTYQKGWEMIKENIPFNNSEAEIGINGNGEYLLLLFHVASRTIDIINLNTGEQLSTQFQEWKTSVYKSFFFYKDRFYYCYLGYPSRHWTFEWSDEIITRSFEHIPKEITEELKRREEAEVGRVGNYGGGGVLKNVTAVFINQVNNLVLNNHELRLNEHGFIGLENSGFKQKAIEAAVEAKDRFRFADGSSVTVHRSGMLLLESSDPLIYKIYVPLALDESLGVVSNNVFAGNSYYHHSRHITSPVMKTTEFWEEHITPFINNIKMYGTKVTTV